MFTRVKKALFIIAVGSLVGACSVAMAAKKQGVEINEIMACQSKTCFLGLRDTMAIETIADENMGGEWVSFKSLQKQGSTGRAVMHGLLDVATLGIWEVAGTPIEGAKGKDKFFLYRVHFDTDGNSTKIEMVQ